MKRRNFQIVAGLLFALVLLAYPTYSKHFSLSVEQALGAFVGFGTFCFWYFDARMETLAKDVQDGLRANVSDLSLAEALNQVCGVRRRWRRIRILAPSTELIQPLFTSCSLEADRVGVILRKVRDEQAARDVDLHAFREGRGRSIAQWRALEASGRIQECSIQECEFFPLDYAIIFDEEALITGLLVPTPRFYSQVFAENPTVTFSRTQAARRHIARHVRRHDGLEALAEVLGGGRVPNGR